MAPSLFCSSFGGFLFCFNWCGGEGGAECILCMCRFLWFLTFNYVVLEFILGTRPYSQRSIKPNRICSQPTSVSCSGRKAKQYRVVRNTGRGWWRTAPPSFNWKVGARTPEIRLQVLMFLHAASATIIDAVTFINKLGDEKLRR